MRSAVSGTPPAVPQRFHALDVLRGLAALAVVFWHWQNFFLTDPTGLRLQDQPGYAWFRPLYDSGSLAVDLFFALSGFIFFWLYAERVGQRRVSGAEFLVLRASRLLPLHLVTLLLVAAGQAWYQARHGAAFVYPHNDAWHFVLHLLLIPSIGLEAGHGFNAPVWSVSVEAVLYLLFFLLCRHLRPRWPTLLLLALLGLFVLSRVYLPLGRGVGAFFLGGCVYHLYLWMLRSPHRARWTAAVVAAALLLWTLTLLASYTGWSLEQVAWLRIFHWKYPTAVLFPVTILALALAETWRGSLGARLAVLGDISYAAYLWHFPLQLAVVLALPLLGLPLDVLRTGGSLLLFFVLLLALSLASHRWLEMPAQAALRRRWQQRSARHRQLA